MTTFTPQQIEELLKTIDKHILKFVSTNVGTKYLTSSDILLLKKYGIKTGSLQAMTIEQSFKFGILSQALSDGKANKISFADFKKNIKNKNFLPLDYREVNALRQLEFQAYNEIKGLGNKIKGDFSKIMIEADKKQREKYEGIIQETARETVLTRGGVKEMRSALGHKTLDWARDFDRMSDYILHEAHDHGRAMGIERHDGKDAKVYKRVFDHACQHCARLYLTAGAGSEPIIFKLSELRANGTNVGRKVIDWKPVIGATHPWCRCQLEYFPEAAEWDAKEQKFEIVSRSDRAAEIEKRIKTLGLVKITQS